MSSEKFKESLLCLEKIARETGEDEYDAISQLEQIGIQITQDETSPFRANQKAIWIVEPFDKFRYERARKEFTFCAPSHLIEKYVQKVEKDGKLYLKYPQNVELSLINENIREILKNEYCIKDDDLTEIEWLNLHTTEEWKRCEKQIARELISNDFAQEYNV